MRLISLLILAGSVAVTTAALRRNAWKQSFHSNVVLAGRRRLEDAQNNNGVQQQNLPLAFGKCVFVKLPDNDNDDAAEGNSYFYNGRYYAQHEAYASFHYCNIDENFSYENEDGEYQEPTCPVACATPDYYFVRDLAGYLEERIEYLQNLCGLCQNQCNGDNNNNEDDRDEGDRRRLEDEEEEDEQQVDCDTCVSTCQYINDQDNQNLADETQYLECQQAFAGDDGNYYYSAPGCDSDGNIVIGLYHNDECTVKSAQEYDTVEFSYAYFQTIQGICVDCGNNNDDEEEVCGLDDVVDVCDQDGHSVNGDDDNDLPLCQKFYQVHKERTYAKRRKKQHFIGLIILGVLMLFCCCMGSYTYFVRHNRKANKVPMASTEGGGEPTPDTSSTPNVPPLT